ncbi:UNVERIFIED_CONTAM: hypothetical protein Sangu_1554100 [Sesamum angustifolium]|uniref:Retrotransposon gag domain-containing protein n=1 Tax=Sesamum angustifolium TaxID=2727405 RepID=A0AAW2MRK3_9LAMI
MEGTPRREPTHDDLGVQGEHTPTGRDEDVVHISKEGLQRIIDAASRNAIVEYKRRTLTSAAQESIRRQLFKEKEAIQIQRLGQQIDESKRRGEMVAQNRNSPFANKILTQVVDASFSLSDLPKYDGTKDPQEHVSTFELVMNLYGQTDSINAKLFVTTLTGKAHEWFTNLPNGTVELYNQLIQKFTFHFASKKKERRSATYLFTIRQQEDESLKSFIGRFNNETLEVHDLRIDKMVSIIRHRLKRGPFASALVRDRQKM